MEPSLSPAKERTSAAQVRRPPRKRLGDLRVRSIVAGTVAALVLVLLIALGSRGFHWFDATLIGYAVGTIFATAAVTYKYTFWLARPPTGRYWRRSWQLFLSYANFRRYTALIPAAIGDLFSQQFIRRRGVYRWITHQCIFWGVILSCLYYLSAHLWLDTHDPDNSGSHRSGSSASRCLLSPLTRCWDF